MTGGGNSLSTFNISRTKIVPSYHHRACPDFSPIAMNGCPLGEAPTDERGILAQPRPRVELVLMIRSIDNDGGKMVAL